MEYPDRGGAWEGKDDNPLSLAGKIVLGIGQVIMDVLIVFIGIVWYKYTYSGCGK